MIVPITRLAVTIPARNEQDVLGTCLDALEVAVSAVSSRVSVRCVIVAHRSTDATERIARSRGFVEVLVVDHGNVGTARAEGVARAIREVEPGADLASVWIASTDADSAVPPNWLAVQLDLAESGADLILGSVIPDLARLDSSRSRAWLSWHRREGGREHVHGANLGIRASTYLNVGGFQPGDLDEDVDLVERARSSGAKVAIDRSAVVATSARLSARASGGYASWLRDRLTAIDDPT